MSIKLRKLIQLRAFQNVEWSALVEIKKISKTKFNNLKKSNYDPFNLPYNIHDHTKMLFSCR